MLYRPESRKFSLKVNSENVSYSVVSGSLPSHGLQPARFLSPWDSPGKNTGVGCHFLLPGDFSDPGIEPESPELQAVYLLSEPLFG